MSPEVHATEIELILRDPREPENSAKELSVFFNVLNTSIAGKYVKLLIAESERQLKIWQPTRLYNFPGDYRDRYWISAELNKALKIIEEYQPGTIHHLAEPYMSQDLMNHLHKYFEVLRGAIDKGTPFFNTAPDEVRSAVDMLNLMIHRYEDYERNEKDPSSKEVPAAHIIVNWIDRKRVLIEDEDYIHFSRYEEFGYWMIDYCEVGKNLWELFEDDDHIVGDEALRPQRYYSIDAYINFGYGRNQYMVKNDMERFDAWWNKNIDRLERLGFKKDDPKNAVGYMAVARLNREKGKLKGMTNRQIIEEIGQHIFIQSVRVR